MEITSDHYQVALLNEEETAVSIIKEAEAAITRATGNEVTLIAYEKSEKE
ncbi:hypothetical protein [Paenibacillus lentus]|nr:hypothetical protein [Paenibacillus lentus]